MPGVERRAVEARRLVGQVAINAHVEVVVVATAATRLLQHRFRSQQDVLGRTAPTSLAKKSALQRTRHKRVLNDHVAARQQARDELPVSGVVENETEIRDAALP